MFLGHKRYWWFQALGWGMFFFIHLFFAWVYGKLSTPEEARIFITRDFGYVFIGVLVSHLMRIAIQKGDVLKRNIPMQIVLLLLLTLTSGFLAGIMELNLFKFFHLFSAKQYDNILKRGDAVIILSNTFSWVLYFAIWNLIYLIYHYLTDYQNQQIQTLQLKSLVKELELKTIKSHINPHFIFNSLNSIRAMVDENPERAREAITELSHILRSSINLDKNESIALKDELALVKDYLALEQMRFEDRLSVKYDIAPATLEKNVPPMMLQTLVENAIKHGIGQQVQGGNVSVSASIADDMLELCVENTGILDTVKEVQGFGIRSIKERLRLLYGVRCHFEIRQAETGLVQATLHIPVL
ncbi:MAG: histidine kinase [Niabella sp.]